MIKNDSVLNFINQHRETSARAGLFFHCCLILSLHMPVQAEGVLQAQDSLPTQEEILSKMVLVNDYWISKNSDPGTNKWDRAAYFVGNMAAYRTIPEKEEYLEYAESWGEKHNWSLNRNDTTTHADDHCAGQTYIDLYNYDPDPIKVRDITSSISAMVNGSRVDYWWWVDAFFMAMPTFTELGILHNDEDYFEAMYDYYNDNKVRRQCYNTTEHLWYRDEKYLPPYEEPNGEDCYWSRGNGWVLAAHARVLEFLPQTDLHREEYIQTLVDMAVALKEVQRDDGFWNPSLHDPTNFGGPESSGTGFFTFGIAWGINNGFLDRNDFLPVVARAWHGLTTIAVQPDGFLGYCQPIGQLPAEADSASIKDYAVGAFLLAGSELVKLAGATDTKVNHRSTHSSFCTIQSQNGSVCISYKNIATQPKQLSVSLYTLAGIKLREFTTTITAENHTIQWNGYSDAGKKVAPGTYLVRVVEKNRKQAGNTNQKVIEYLP